ncbi:MAG: hypothetical protein INH43_26035 [Acidobacteriaceae bacterium]|nr:hypothetical protein [Acidobacteriaceae bacterium]
MLSDCRRLLLLLAASWAILSLARLSPIQVTEEIPPVLLYGVPGFLTVAICFLPPQSWEPERWFVVSAVVLVAAVAICWLPIAISFWMVMPSSFGSSVVSLPSSWGAPTGGGDMPARCPRAPPSRRFAWSRHFCLITSPPTSRFPSNLVWRRQLGKCPAHCELSSKELVVGAKRGTAQRRIPLEQLAGSDPPDLSDPTDLSKM